MGKKDSTKTRVEPLMDYLGNDVDKINSFLSMFDCKVQITDTICKICYGKKSHGCPGEKSIPAPVKLLRWYIENSDQLDQSSNEQDKNGHPSQKTIDKRESFFKRDEKLVKEANEAIRKLEKKIRRIIHTVILGIFLREKQIRTFILKQNLQFLLEKLKEPNRNLQVL